MLAAPQDCELNPQIHPRRKLEKGIKPRRGKSPFSLIPLFPLPTHSPDTPKPQRKVSPKPPGEKSHQPPLPQSFPPGGLILPPGWWGERGRLGGIPGAKRKKRRALWLGFVLGQLDKAGGNDVCPGQRVLIS